MRVGVVRLPVDSWPVTMKRVTELEELGFDHFWLYDHLSWQRYRDDTWHATMPWLSAMAASTERIRLGTMVASPNLRHPLTMAKETMSLDHISGGRFILGIGGGTSGFDASVFGDDPLTPLERTARLVEYVAVVDGLLRGELTNHRGDWYTVDEGRVIPGCVQQPRVPIAVAGGGPKSISLAAETADTWITLGRPSQSPADIAEFASVLARQATLLDQRCAELGREPTDIARLCFVSSAFAEPMSSFEAFVDLAGRVTELGFTDIVVHDRRAEDPVLDYHPDLIAQIAQWGAASQRPDRVS